MRAISATVGVEEGAVRALAAGADALCLGHDLFDESVVARARRARRGGSVGSDRRGASRVGCVARRRFGPGSARRCRPASTTLPDVRRRAERCGSKERRGSTTAACSSSSSSRRSGWPRVVCRSFRASGSRAVVPDADVVRFDAESFDAGRRAGDGAARDHRPRCASSRLGARRDRGADGARGAERSSSRSASRSGVRTRSGDVRRDVRRRPRQRGSGRRGAILRPATRGGAVR